MNDETRLAIEDSETPVNPYSLLAAVNASSRSANVAWLIFIALMAYLAITTAGITHRDLLLDSDVALPVLQTQIGLKRFFVLAPIVLVVMHVALLGRLALLARKTMEFNASLRLLESTDRRTHPLRLEVDSFFLVQAAAGPERSRVMTAFLNSVSWLTLVILPVALLLYLQIAFLPFHDAAITMVHRLAVLADVLLLGLVGIFLIWPETSYFGAFWRTALYNPGSLAFGVAALVAAALLSAFAAVPSDGYRDAWSRGITSADGALFGIFPRNLDVSGVAPAGGDLGPGGRGINLRGRDLRFARLDRADLHQADMTGANLDGASLAGADLRNVRLRCDNTADQRPAEARPGVACASARTANFADARLDGADMAGVDLRGARFEGARLDGAILSKAQMTGVDFSRADLRRADLSGAALQGAVFEGANLQGTDLAGGRLQMADFSRSAMQGVILSSADLDGAMLRDAALDGANLRAAKLFGADLRGASLRLADMSGAFVWQTTPPGSDAIASTDMAALVVNPPTEEDMSRVRQVIKSLETAPDKVRLAGLTTPLNEAGRNAGWNSSPEGQAWTSLVRTSEQESAEGQKARITEQLAGLACRARFADGAVATGIVRRASATGFKGDPAALYEKLRSADCPAGTAVPPGAWRALAAAADASRAP